MKIFRAMLLTAAAVFSLAPGRAEAGAATASCMSNGQVLIESIDHAVLRYPDIWDFEIRSVSLGGESVNYSMSMDGPLERYIVEAIPQPGDILEFEFRQLRNNSDGGNSFWSEWTVTRFEPARCQSALPPATTTVATTTTEATTTTTTVVPPSTLPGPTTTTIGTLLTVAPQPGEPNQPNPPGPDPDPLPDEPRPSTLPFTGTPNTVMFIVAVLCVAFGASALVLRMRETGDSARA